MEVPTVADEKPLDEQADESPWKYSTNPVPWWLALLWIGYFVWSVVYLVMYLI